MTFSGCRQPFNRRQLRCASIASFHADATVSLEDARLYYRVSIE
jgi:hypothetical protein